jgi:putative transposase
MKKNEKKNLDRLLADYKKPEDLIGETGLLKQLPKALLERALDAELTEYRGHTKHAQIATKGGNLSNGKSSKSIKGDFGKLPINVPRDRDSSFEPVIIPKGQTRRKQKPYQQPGTIHQTLLGNSLPTPHK